MFHGQTTLWGKPESKVSSTEGEEERAKKEKTEKEEAR